MSNRTFMLTGEQIRAARALARIDQTDLAQRCSLSLETIKRLERIRGPAVANVSTLNAIARAFEAMGIHFDARQDGAVGVYWTPGQAASARVGGEPAAQASDAPLHRLIYWSRARPASGVSMMQILNDILSESQARNAALGITGCLYAREGLFLQVLEGAREAVWQVFGAISSDPRHTAIHPLENRSVATRYFPDWTLGCGLLPSDDALFEAEPAFAEGFRPDSLSPASALGLLAMVRELQRSPPRSGRGQPAICALAAECVDHACAGPQDQAAA